MKKYTLPLRLLWTGALLCYSVLSRGANARPDPGIFYSYSFPDDRILTCDPTVKDTVKPVLKCKEPFNVSITQTGMVTLWPLDLVASVTDNCSALKLAIGYDGFDLRDSLFDPFTDIPSSTITLNCCDLGPNIFKVWVKDAAGNRSFCTTQVLLQDNHSRCCGPVGNGGQCWLVPDSYPEWQVGNAEDDSSALKCFSPLSAKREMIAVLFRPQK